MAGKGCAGSTFHSHLWKTFQWAPTPSMQNVRCCPHYSLLGYCCYHCAMQSIVGALHGLRFRDTAFLIHMRMLIHIGLSNTEAFAHCSQFFFLQFSLKHLHGRIYELKPALSITCSVGPDSYPVSRFLVAGRNYVPVSRALITGQWRWLILFSDFT